MIKEYCETAEQWDAHVYHPIQSWQWGEIRKKHGITVIRHTDGIHHWQMTIHVMPFTKWKVGIVWKSPLPTEEYLAFIQIYARNNNIISVTYEPCVLQSQSYTLSSLLHHTQGTWPLYTQVLDLQPDEKALMANLHPKTRYNIRLAQRKGVVVKECSDDAGYAIFEKLYFETCARQKYSGHSPTYHRTIWNALNRENSLQSHILIAYLKDEPLAAYQLWKFHNTWYYPYGGSSLKYRTIMGANALMWEAILLGKRLGCKTFDMWGSLSPQYDKNDPWAGFTRFKEGYGTQFQEYIGAYTLVMSPPKQMLFNTIRKIRTKII